MLASLASTINRIWEPSGESIPPEKFCPKATTSCTSPDFITSSISSGVSSHCVTVKYSLASSLSAICRTVWSDDGERMAIFTLRTSVESAKPNRMMSTTGMTSTMSIVRLSRRMW